MENPEIPAFIKDQRRREARQKVRYQINKIGRVLTVLFHLVLYIAILMAGYAGYKQLEKESMVVYVRETINEEVIPPHSIVSATVTAYTSSVDETDDDPFVTASGKLVRVGTLACPSKYKFGTVVEIQGERYTCEDRMNKRYRHTERFDIWVKTKRDAYLWGKQELLVKVYLNN